MYNLKKYSQVNSASFDDLFGADSSPKGLDKEQLDISSQDMEGDLKDLSQDESHETFSDHGQLKDYLKQFSSPADLSNANKDIYSSIYSNENSSEAFKDFLASQDPEQKLNDAKIIFKNLPDYMKEIHSIKEDKDGSISMETEQEKFSTSYKNVIIANKIVNNDINLIKKIASIYAEKLKKKGYNQNKINKIAQSISSLNNVILWGPSQSRPDPFLFGQPVSDWHIMERNKGFGGQVDGVWDIDWEAVWRGTVMDKFSSPYRDTETGEWIGGYLQKRFEMDKNIPATNNYQLLPGQLRKPILPEYGLIEARMQNLRNKNKQDLEVKYNNTDKPYDWNKLQYNEATGTKYSSKNKVASKIEQIVNFVTTKTASNKDEEIDPTQLIFSQPEQSEEYKNYFLNNLKESNTKTSWLNEGRKSQLNTGIKQLKQLGDKKDHYKVTGNKMICPNCGSQLASNSVSDGSIKMNNDVCNNCGHKIDKAEANSGSIQNPYPDVKKEKEPRKDQNVRLASKILFDSNTKKFILSYSEEEDPNTLKTHELKKKHFPKKKFPKKINDSFIGKEFKSTTDKKLDKDEIHNSCNDLAIDG